MGEVFFFYMKATFDKTTYSLILNLLEEKIEQVKAKNPHDKNLWRYRLACYKWRLIGKKNSK